MFNPITAAALARALHADRMAEVEAARRATQVARRRRRRSAEPAEPGYTHSPSPILA
ncbi:MAG: hypothetical protein FWJ92_01040 [Actinomycetes bacterium]